MAREEVLVLIPESTRKHPGGERGLDAVDRFAEDLPAAARKRLETLRADLLEATGGTGIEDRGLLPAFRRYDGTMYRHIDPEAWDRRAPGVDVLIVSGLLGVVASRDTIPAYVHSMAEPMPPLGKLNRWWHDAGLADILREFLGAARPKAVVDLLSQEYRAAVDGYQDGLRGIALRTIDFPGLGRASQPRRGDRVAEILRSGAV